MMKIEENELKRAERHFDLKKNTFTEKIALHCNSPPSC